MRLDRLADRLPRPIASLLILIVVFETSFLTLVSRVPDVPLDLATLFCVVFIIWSRQGSRLANKLAPLRRMTSGAIYNDRLVQDGLAFLVVLLPFLVWLWWPLGAAFALAIALASAPLALRQLRVILFHRRIRRDTERRYLDMAPPVVLYISGPSEVAYQVNQWLPVLEALPFKVVVIVRNIGIFTSMKRTKLPVFYARGGKETEWLLNNGPKVALYPNNREKNVNALRYPHIVHIFINHGESDKSVNQSKMLMAYDHLFVGGSLAGKRLVQAGLPVREGQVVPVGRPQAEILLTEGETGKPVRNVLYAPTWEGGVEATDYSSVGPFSVELLELLAARGDLRVKLKPHPLTGSRSPRARAAMRQMRAIAARAPNVELIDRGEGIHDVMNWSDMMITDISAVLADYLVTNKPVVLCGHFARGRSPAEFAEEFPLSEAAYVISAPGDITDVLAAVANGDPRGAGRERIRREAIGEPGAVARFENRLEEIMSEHRRDRLGV